MHQLILIRHGESQWNKENRFTGWHDVDLSDRGAQEAVNAGQLLKREGYGVDMAFTSLLKRAIRTLWAILDELDRMWIPVHRSWRLNERHYGALQGLDKRETAKKYGDAQVNDWRRSFNVAPPGLGDDDERLAERDPRYAGIDPRVLPRSESLKGTIARFMPYWHDAIVPEMQAGKRVLVCAHGNSLRALVKYLDRIADEDVLELEIPTGAPLVYELDKKMEPTKRYYLGDEQELRRLQVEALADEGKVD